MVSTIYIYARTRQKEHASAMPRLFSDICKLRHIILCGSVEMWNKNRHIIFPYLRGPRKF